MKSRAEQIAAVIYRLTDLSKQTARLGEIAKQYEESSVDQRERDQLERARLACEASSANLARAAHGLLWIAPKVEAKHKPIDHK